MEEKKSVLILKRISLLVAIGFVCFHLYTAIFGVLPGIGQKSVHLGCLLVIFYITAIMESKKTADRIFLVLMGLFGVAGTVYITVLDETLQARSGIVYLADIICGILLIVSIFEACRRKLKKRAG